MSVDLEAAAALQRIRLSASIPLASSRAELLQGEVDELRAVLRDIVLGADIMLRPPVDQKSAIASYAREIRRVAKGALDRGVRI